MDTQHAGTRPSAPLTDAEVATVGAYLQHLRRRRDAGDLSDEGYSTQVRGILERRRRTVPGHVPERRSQDPRPTT